MDKRGSGGTRAFLLPCVLAALALCMPLAVPADFPAVWTGGRAAGVLRNLSLSLQGRTFLLLAAFCGLWALRRFGASVRREMGPLFHLGCLVVAGIWLTGRSFAIDNTLDELTRAPGQITKSLLYYAGAVCLMEIAGAAITAFLDSGRDLPAERFRLPRFAREHCFGACFLAFLLCCLPSWIICYPGYMEPDAYCQLAYYFGIYEFYAQFAPLHTMFLSLPVRLGQLLGSANLGLFLIVTVHMLCFCAVFAYLMTTLRAFGAPRWLQLLAFLTVVLAPHFIVMLSYIAKDSIYSYGLTLFVLEIAWMLRLGGAYWADRGHRLRLMLAIFATMAMRVNGKYLIYVCILFYIPFLFFRLRRDGGMKAFAAALICFLAPVILAVAADAALMRHYDIIPGSKREALSLPFQQTARYDYEHGDDMSAEEKEIIRRVLLEEKLGASYDPMDSSGVKQYYQDDCGAEALKAYFGVWLRQGLRHPLSYLKATLNQNYPLFSPWTGSARVRGATESARHTHISGPIGLYDVHFADGAEELLSGLDRLMNALPFPGLCANMGFSTLLLLMLCCLAIRRRDGLFLLLALPGLLTVGTIFLAPAAQTRLALANFYTMPLLLCMAPKKRG